MGGGEASEEMPREHAERACLHNRFQQAINNEIEQQWRGDTEVCLAGTAHQTCLAGKAHLGALASVALASVARGLPCAFPPSPLSMLLLFSHADADADTSATSSTHADVDSSATATAATRMLMPS